MLYVNGKNSTSTFIYVKKLLRLFVQETKLCQLQRYFASWKGKFLSLKNKINYTTTSATAATTTTSFSTKFRQENSDNNSTDDKSTLTPPTFGNFKLICTRGKALCGPAFRFPVSQGLKALLLWKYFGLHLNLTEII